MQAVFGIMSINKIPECRTGKVRTCWWQATCVTWPYLRPVATVVDEEHVTRTRLLHLPGDDLLRTRQTDTGVRVRAPAASLYGRADQLYWQI